MLTYLFNSILEISLSFSLLIFFVLLLSPLFKKIYEPKWKYFLWLFIAIRMVIPFHFSIPNPPLTPSAMSITISGNSLAKKDTITANYMNEQQTDTKEIRDFLSLPILWIIGIIFIMLYQLISYVIFRRSIYRWKETVSNSDLLFLFNQMKNEMNIKAKIKIAVCKKAASPMIMGFFKPMLILPSDKLSNANYAIILKHELIHYKRKDIWYLLLLLVLKSIHWFNPLVYIMSNDSIKNIEISCDSEVVRDMNKDYRKHYTETILSLIHTNKTQNCFLSTSLNGGKKAIKERFEVILDMGKKRKGIFSLILILIVAAVISTFVSCQSVKSVSRPTGFTEESFTTPESLVNTFVESLLINDVEAISQFCGYNIKEHIEILNIYENVRFETIKIVDSKVLDNKACYQIKLNTKISKYNISPLFAEGISTKWITLEKKNGYWIYDNMSMYSPEDSWWNETTKFVASHEYDTIDVSSLSSDMQALLMQQPLYSSYMPYLYAIQAYVNEKFDTAYSNSFHIIGTTLSVSDASLIDKVGYQQLTLYFNFVLEYKEIPKDQQTNTANSIDEDINPIKTASYPIMLKCKVVDRSVENSTITLYYNESKTNNPSYIDLDTLLSPSEGYVVIPYGSEKLLGTLSLSSDGILTINNMELIMDSETNVNQKYTITALNTKTKFPLSQTLRLYEGAENSPITLDEFKILLQNKNKIFWVYILNGEIATIVEQSLPN